MYFLGYGGLFWRLGTQKFFFLKIIEWNISEIDLEIPNCHLPGPMKIESKKRIFKVDLIFFQ